MKPVALKYQIKKYQMIMILLKRSEICNFRAFTGVFTEVFIYADDITLLATSRASLALMLEVFREHMTFCSMLQKQNIWFSSIVR